MTVDAIGTSVEVTVVSDSYDVDTIVVMYSVAVENTVVVGPETSLVTVAVDSGRYVVSVETTVAVESVA